MTKAASSLEGDFSRFLYQPRKQYSWVQQQQGRALLETDWNAQMALLAHRLDTEFEDLIGAEGGPVDGAGFKVEPSSALSFSGFGAVAMGTDSSLGFDGRSVFSIEAVVGAGSHGTVISRCHDSGPEDTATGGYLLKIDAHGRPCWCRWYLSRDTDNGDRRMEFRRLRSSTPLEVDRSNHIAVIHDGGACRLYLNGVETAADLGVAEGRSGEAELLLGATGTAAEPRESLIGELLSVRVWNIALTPEELGSEVDAETFGLVADWPLNDLTGSTVEDRTGRHGGVIFAQGEPPSPSWVLSGLRVSPGRYYVEGMLCERFPETDPAGDVGRFGEDRLSAELLAKIQPVDPGGDYRIFLDLWELYVTAIQDPLLREIALGGPTTTTRSQVLPQIDIAPWSRAFPPTRTQGLLNARRLPGEGSLENRFYRVEIQRSGIVDAAEDLRGSVWQGRLLSSFELVLDDASNPPIHGDLVTVVSVEQQGGSGGIAEVLEFDPESRRCMLDLDVGHELGVEPGSIIELRPKPRVPSFKWSRQNGSVTLAIHPLEAGSKQVTVKDPEQLDQLAPGEWIEILDDLALQKQRHPRLVQIDTIDFDTFTLTLVQTPPAGVGTQASLHPFLRRWDQQDNAEIQLQGGAVPIQGKSWTSLELGIQVKFDEAFYQSGDYWFFAARRESGDIEWPRNREMRPEPQPAMGIRHRYATLARLKLTPAGPQVEDERVLFPNLTSLAVPSKTDLSETAPSESVQSEAVPSEPPSETSARETALRDFEPRVEEETSVDLEQRLDQMAEAWAQRLEEHLETGSEAARRAADEAVQQARASDAESFAHQVREVVADFLESRKTEAEAETGEISEPVDTASAEARGAEWPRDSCILSPSPEPEPGFEATDWFVVPQSDLPPWSSNTLDLELNGQGDDARDTRRGVSLVAEVGDRLLLAGESGIWQWTPYDPPELLAPLAGPRKSAAFAELGGRLHAVGGVGAKDEYLASMECFDPESGETTHCAHLVEGRADLALAVWDGKLVAVGGEERTLLRHASPKVELYDPGTDSWSRLPDLPHGLVAPTAVAVGGGLHVLGGRGELKQNGHYSDRHWVLSPDRASWQVRQSVPTPRQHAAGVDLDGRLYLIGGEDGSGGLEIMEVYDPRLDTWLPSSFARLPAPAAWPAAAVISQRLTVAARSVDDSEPRGRLHLHRYTPPPRLWAHRRQSSD